MRKILYFITFLFIFSCQNESSNSKVIPIKYLKIAGKTMGTTYHITYLDSLQRNFKNEVDSILVKINQDVSTYIKDSEISKFNFNQKTEFSNDDFLPNYFLDIYWFSELIFEKTDGYFDPTVMPLVNYWGFGYQEKKPVSKVDKLKVDSLMTLVGFDKITADCDGDNHGQNCIFSKKDPSIQLDFSAIAKGFAVDVIAEYLEEKNVDNYLVEIGGEILVAGKNPNGKLWTTAINTPKINAKLNESEAIISLNNKAIATSGNYRNFYEVNGEWYGHEINPKTGFPEKSKLLSVSVMAENCMSADAYATAMMVMGLEKSKALVKRLDNLDAFFIFANDKGELETFYTIGFEGNVMN